MRKNVCYDNYYDFPFDAAIPKFTAHLCIKLICPVLCSLLDDGIYLRESDRYEQGRISGYVSNDNHDVIVEFLHIDDDDDDDGVITPTELRSGKKIDLNPHGKN